MLRLYTPTFDVVSMSIIPPLYLLHTTLKQELTSSSLKSGRFHHAKSPLRITFIAFYLYCRSLFSLCYERRRY